jgi:hypothetical protein
VGTDIAGTAGNEDLGHEGLLVIMGKVSVDNDLSGILFLGFCQARRGPKLSSVLPFTRNFER